MQRLKFSLVCLLSVAWIASASAQTLDVGDVVESSTQEFSGGFALEGISFDVFNTTGNGVGYQHGYSQLGAFVPLWNEEDWLVASNSRVNITDTQRIGLNTGVLIRRYVPEVDRLFGFNVFYDDDESINGHRYNQWGVGVESLGRWLDFRSNIYLPIAHRRYFAAPAGLGADPFFIDNRLAYLGTRITEENQFGGDFEFGVPLMPQAPWLRGYAGMYFYDGTDQDAVGVRGRAEAWISDDFNIGVQVTEDQKYGTNVNANVTFRFSGFKPTRYFPYWTTRERMTMPVNRNWRVATNTYAENVPISIINPLDNQPYFVTWVDNSNTRAGDGTFENPFQAMPNTAPNSDLVLVKRGNTSAAAPLLSNITLPNDARMLGEGRAHRFDGYATFGPYARAGNYRLPDPVFQDTGNYPFLTSGGNAVTLANNNEVSAFNIIGAPGAAITNTPAGSNRFNINHVNLANNSRGIFLQNTNGFSFLSDVSAQGNPNGNIQIDTGTGADPLVLRLNNVVANGATAGPGIQVIADSAPAEVIGDNILANGNVTGIELLGTGGDIAATLTNVTAGGNSNANLSIGASAGGTAQFNLTGGDFSLGGGNGIQYVADGGGVASRLTNVTASSNARDGILISGVNGSLIDVSVFDSQFNANGEDAFNVFAGSGSTVNFFVDPTSATGSGRHGLNFNLTGGSRLAARLIDVDLSRSGSIPGTMGDAVHGMSDASTFDLALIRVNGAEAGANGLFITANNVSNGSLGIVDSNFSRMGRNTPGSSGIWTVANTGSVFTSDIFRTPAQNLFDDNGAYGLRVRSNGPGSVNNVYVHDGNFSNMSLNAVAASAVAGGRTGVLLDRVTATNSQLTGVNFTANGVNSRIDVAVLESNLNDNGRFGVPGSNRGVNGLLTNGAVGTLVVRNSTVQNSGEDGVAVTAVGSQFAGQITSSNISDNGALLNGLGDGIRLDGVANSTMFLTLEGATQVNNSNGLTRQTQVNGLNVNADGSLVAVTASNSNLNNNTTNGIRAALTGGSQFGLYTDFVGISNNGAGGIAVGANNSMVDMSLIRTQVVDNAGPGLAIALNGAGPASSRLVFDASNFNRNQGDGFAYDIRNGAGMLVVGSNSSFSNNLGNGIGGLVDGVGSVVNFNSLINATMNNNVGSGFAFQANNGGAVVATISGGSTSFNQGDGIGGAATNGGIVSLSVDGTSIRRNGGNGIRVVGGNNTPVFINLNDLLIDDNALDGVVADLGTGGGSFALTNSEILSNGGNAVDVRASGGSSQITITDNNMIANGGGIFVDLSGTAVAAFNIDRNTLSGTGRAASFDSIGLNFTAYTEDSATGGEPPDTMGAVGPQHVIVLTNDFYQVFDKSTGALLMQLSIDDFWTAFGANLGGLPTSFQKTFDPRIVYDAGSGRWFATAIDFSDNAANLGNTIYVAVSNSSNPLDGWKTVQFVGDSERLRFNDFDTLGVDSEGLYISTNDFGATTDVSIFVIPKADLLAAGGPSIARLQKFENLNIADPNGRGFALQPVNNTDDPDGIGTLLAVSGLGGATLTRTDVLLSGTGISTLANPVDINVPNWVRPDFFAGFQQPDANGNSNFIDVGDSRFSTSAVEVKGEIWVAHSVAETTGPGDLVTNAVVRWYRIDKATNALLESGEIEVPDALGNEYDLHQPSIAVNDNGTVVIGVTASHGVPLVPFDPTGPTPPTVNPDGYARTFAILGSTVNGTTTFGTARELKAGTDSYEGGRWGDYSATVVDPTDPNSFWTIQQFAVSGTQYGVQVSQILSTPSVQGSSLGTAIDVRVRENAHVTQSSISNNTISDFTLHGIHVTLNDFGRIDNLVANGNNVTNNGGTGFYLESFPVGTPTLTGVAVNGGTYSNNAQGGVDMRLYNVQGNPVLTASNVTVDNNGGRGISIAGFNSGVGNVNLNGNTVTNSGATSGAPDGQGILLSLINNNPLPLGNVSINGNTVQSNQGTGIDVVLQNTTGFGSLTANNNTVGGTQTAQGNAGFGFSLVGNDAQLGDILMNGNTFQNNTAGDGARIDLTNGTLASIDMANTTSIANTGYGILTRLSNVAGVNGVAPRVSIDGSNVQSNTGRGALGSGIAVEAVDTPLTLVSITNSANVSNNFGDGIRVFGTNSAIGELIIDGNDNIDSNSLNGVNIGLVDSPVGAMTVSNNQVNNTPPPPPVSAFDIDLTLSGMTPSQIAVFQLAAQRWEQLIIGDLPNVGAIDDLSIDGSAVPIDGVNGILGQAGPTGLRAGSFLPFSGIMQFDTADIAALEAAGQLDEVILHEMGHVLGFGTIWNQLGLIQGSGTANPLFIGPQALAAYNARFGLNATGVPLENTGGPGTANSHWRETVFQNELMTGFLNGGVANPLSAITVAQFADEGYVVDATTADPFIMASGASGSQPLAVNGRFVALTTSNVQSVNSGIGAPAPISANTQDGVRIALTRSNVGSMAIQNNIIRGNGAHGVELDVIDSTLPSSLANPILVTGNTIEDQLNGSGFRMVNPDTNGSPIAIAFANNVIQGNLGGPGIDLQLPDQALLATISGNTIGPATPGAVFDPADPDRNEGAGINMLLGGQGVAHEINLIDNVSISNNNGAGVNITVADNSVLNSQIRGNQNISANNGAGITITGAIGSQINIADFSGNTINDNSGLGLRISAANPQNIAPPLPSIIFNAGGFGANVLDNNLGAGIGFNLTDNRVLSLTLANTAITNTRAGGTDAVFTNGTGLDIRLVANAQMPNALILSSAFNNNAGGGVVIDLNGTSQVTNLLVQQSQFNNNTGTPANDTNNFNGNGDGFRMTRSGSAVVDNVILRGNQFNGNQNDGIDLTAGFAAAAGGPLTDEYFILANTIDSNDAHGIRLFAQGDALLDATLTSNLINNNGLDGVHVTTTALSGGDAAAVIGVWTLNTITSNGRIGGVTGAGIDIDGTNIVPGPTFNGTHNITIGNIGQGNLIADNAGDGIEVDQSGTIAILGNDIVRNNTASAAVDIFADSDAAGIDLNDSSHNALIFRNNISDNFGDGIEFQSNFSSNNAINVIGNLIQRNRRDGIEIENGGATAVGSTNAIALDSNIVTDNRGRGIDIFNRNSATLTLTITDATFAGNSQVLRNGQEGVRVMNTASGVQNRNVSSALAFDDTGAIGRTPFLTFNMFNTIVADNGGPNTARTITQAANVNNGGWGNGLVMLVGATRGNDGFTSAGGAGTGFASNANGGIIATVTGNALTGNFGSDFLVESFNSIVNPATTGGAWTDQNDNPRNDGNNVFNPTGYQSDPLARLDLILTNNTAEEGSVARLGAFFNNTEAIFKSRTANQDGNDPGPPDDNGPFSNQQGGNRARNAQRFAARNVNFGGTPLDPSIANGANFLFPGLGQSTFRIQNAANELNTNNFGVLDGFFIDNPTYTDVTDANGFFYPNPPNFFNSIFDAMPYGWTQF